MKKQISKKLEEGLEEIFKEILTDQILNFSYEELNGMSLKFLDGDQFTELSFGNLEIYFNEKVLNINSEKELLACKEKDWFVKRKILNVDLINGNLVFIFEDKNKLIFKHSEMVENWELRWRSKVTLVSIPGGDFDIF